MIDPIGEQETMAYIMDLAGEELHKRIHAFFAERNAVNWLKVRSQLRHVQDIEERIEKDREEMKNAVRG